MVTLSKPLPEVSHISVEEFMLIKKASISLDMAFKSHERTTVLQRSHTLYLGSDWGADGRVPSKKHILFLDKKGMDIDKWSNYLR